MRPSARAKKPHLEKRVVREESREAALSTSQARVQLSELVSRAAFAKVRTLLTRNGKLAAAIVPIEDVTLLEEIEDAEDVRLAEQAERESKRKGRKPIPWAQVKKELRLK